MGLATPAAIMAAANTAARRGILIRDGVALEKAGNITAVVFDKTGTLTEGKPKLAGSKFFPIELPDELKPFRIEELAGINGCAFKSSLEQGDGKFEPGAASDQRF